MKKKRKFSKEIKVGLRKIQITIQLNKEIRENKIEKLYRQRIAENRISKIEDRWLEFI